MIRLARCIGHRFCTAIAGLLAAAVLLLAGCTPPIDGAAGSSTKQGGEVVAATMIAPSNTLAPRPANTTTSSPVPSPTNTPPPSPTPLLTPTLAPSPAASPTATADSIQPVVVGYSAAGRPIYSYRIGQGSVNIVFVGGIHGGYEWNTILLAYQALDYFQSKSESVPEAVTLHIIPNANPDGLYAASQKTGRFQATDVLSDTFPGRFNGNGVDLNRNWDCLWQPTALWRNQSVNAGERAFSEPENQALSQFLLALEPAVVVFLHSAAEGVYAAGCPETDPRSYELAVTYGAAADYPIYERFAYYEVTGDASDWLTTEGIPSITVELQSHQDLDWEQNREGMLALLAEFEEPAAFHQDLENTQSP